MRACVCVLCTHVHKCVHVFLLAVVYIRNEISTTMWICNRLVILMDLIYHISSHTGYCKQQAVSCCIEIFGMKSVAAGINVSFIHNKNCLYYFNYPFIPLLSIDQRAGQI